MLGQTYENCVKLHTDPFITAYMNIHWTFFSLAKSTFYLQARIEPELQNINTIKEDEQGSHIALEVTSTNEEIRHGEIPPHPYTETKEEHSVVELGEKGALVEEEYDPWALTEWVHEGPLFSGKFKIECI